MFCRFATRLDAKAEDIGNALASVLKKPGDEQLICIPLIESVSPPRKEPNMYTLADGVWLIEETRSANRLIPRLYELGGGLPAAIIKVLNSISDRDPFGSEYGALLFAPLIVCRTKGWLSERDHLLRRFGIPLIALHNLARVNNLCPSDTLLVWTYRSPHTFFDLPKEIQEEWTAQIDPDLPSRAASSGLWPYFSSTGFAENFRQVVSYNIQPHAKRIEKVTWGVGVQPLLPPILILPSLLDLTATKKLIEAGERMEDPTASDLHRRIGHATAMWTTAFNHAQEETWEFTFEENEEIPHIADPDSLVLYSTVVLETLFSSSEEKQEVTNRIADFTAALIGGSAEERYYLSKQMKKAYGERSAFVHGRIDRSGSYDQTARWLFEIATHALWKAIDLTILKSRFTKWQDFYDYIDRKKFGASEED